MNYDLAKLVGVAPFDFMASTDGGGLEWQAWVRAFDWYLQANNITDDHVKFVKLMHLAGPKVQELFTTLSVPESVHQVNRGPLRVGFVPHLTEYEMALAKLNEHFQPKKNLTYERHVFRQIKQEPDEKVAFFTMRLRKQADRCDFGDKFEEQVKDQIIEKCSSEKLRLKLLSLGDANLDRIMNEAKVFEAVQEQSEALNDKRTELIKPEDINKIDMRPKPNQGPFNKSECHRCGYTGHHQFDEKCPAKGKTCNKCGGSNHFGRKCRSKKKLRPSKPYQAKSEYNASNETKRDEPAEKKTKTEDTETVKMVDAYQSNLKDNYIFCIGESYGNQIKCKIGGVSVDVVIDSGSKYNIVDSKAWEFLKANKVVVLNQSKGPSHDFKAYGGYRLTMIGSFTAKIETAYKEQTAEFCVLENYGKILIGYETGVPLGVMKIGENVNQVEKTEELSKIKGFVVDIPINKEVKPVAQPYRRMPVPLEEKVDKKIDELLSQGIIEKVNEPSPWISPMVPVPKGEDDVRICLDMKRANEAVIRENYPLPTMEDFLPHIGEGKVFAKLDVKDAFHQV